MGRGFQTVQGHVASGSEGGAASLTAKRLDLLSMTVLPIPDESMDVSVCDPKVQTLLIGTGEALGVDPLGCSSPAFDLAPGPHRQRRRSSTRRGRGGETASGAIVWAAGLEVTVEHGAHLGSCSRLARIRMGVLAT